MGHLPSFFVSTQGDLTAQEPPPRGICHPRQKNANARGSARGGGGWAQVELTDALALQITRVTNNNTSPREKIIELMQ